MTGTHIAPNWIEKPRARSQETASKEMNRFMIILLICVIGKGLASDVFFRKDRLDTAQVIELAWKSLRQIHDSIWHKEPTGKMSILKHSMCSLRLNFC